MEEFRFGPITNQKFSPFLAVSH